MPRLLDLSRESETLHEEQVFGRALALADALRLAKLEKNREKVN
jgi:hypothetical protein